MTTITLSQAAQLTGVPKLTIKWWLRGDFIRSVSHGRYDRQAVLQAVSRRQSGARSSPQCSRCGKHDYGNTCRGGLCFNCYCRDYIAARKPLAAFETHYQQALEAYGLRKEALCEQTATP